MLKKMELAEQDSWMDRSSMWLMTKHKWLKHYYQKLSVAINFNNKLC